jgi:Zn-dependent M28 family amino/carboxypeptidase
MWSIAAAAMALAACLFVSWWVCIRMPGESYAGSFEPLSAQERARAERLRADVHRLAAAIGERSMANPAGLAAAALHVERVFVDLGYAVASHVYDSHGRLVRNVEATLTGTDVSAEVVIVGAHYDSLTGTTGANDNATGVATMLELGRVFAGKPARRTIRFVAFVNEEPPYFDADEMGSQFYASEAAKRGDRIVSMLSLETMGYYSDVPGSQLYPFPLGLFYPSRGNFLAFVGNVSSRSLVHRSIAAFRASSRFPSEGVAAPAWVPGVSWSDHASFWAHGHPAIMITDTALYRYPFYHTVQDVPEHIDFDRLARAASGVAAVVSDLAAY